MLKQRSQESVRSGEKRSIGGDGRSSGLGGEDRRSVGGEGRRSVVGGEDSIDGRRSVLTGDEKRSVGERKSTYLQWAETPCLPSPPATPPGEGEWQE